MHIMQRFDFKQLLQSIQANRITIAYVVPPVVLLLAKDLLVEKYNLSSLRLMHSAAAPLTTDLIEMVYNRLKVPIKQSYGMSEASPAISAQVLPPLISEIPNTNKFSDLTDWNKPMGSVGKLIPSMSMKTMNGGHEVPAGEEGEIWMKGPNIFKGYYKNPKATADAVTNGWFRSGDIAYIDSAGNLF
jgi:4-coumarate--CoA ligase